MILYAWNSRGGQFHQFPHFQWSPPNDTVWGINNFALILSESGWPPWQPNQPVVQNRGYTYNDTSYTNFGNGDALYSCTSCIWPFLEAGRNQRRVPNSAIWWPFVANLDAQTNTRCSSAFITNMSCTSDRFGWLGAPTLAGRQYRQVCTHEFLIRVRNGTRSIKAYSLHLSASGRALDELHDVATAVGETVYDDDTTAIVLGDFNVDLLDSAQRVQAFNAIQDGLTAGRHGGNVTGKWGFINTGQPTQQSGGELDWAFWFDPGTIGHGWRIRKRAGFYGDRSCPTTIPWAEWAWSPSDHAVMQYSIDETRLL